MALSDSQTQRTFLLCAMYCAQGIPRGFMTVALISYLAAAGVGDAALGALSAMIALPWALKFLWGVVIDSVAVPALGLRRPWIFFAQAMMTVTVFGFLLVTDPLDDLRLIGWILFTHNCFAALQDVATDAIAIDLVPECQLAAANGLMMAAKVAGIALGAAGLAQVMDRWGFHAAVAAQLAALWAILLLPLMQTERPGERRFPWHRAPEQPKLSLVLLHPLKLAHDVWLHLLTPSVFALALFGFLASVSEWLIDVINKPFYTKVLGWSFVEFSSLSGLFLAAQVAGALAGACLSLRAGWRPTLLLGLTSYSVLALAFGVLAERSLPWLPPAFLLLAPALNAFGSIGFFAAAMRLARSPSGVTVFTLMMGVMSAGHVVGGSIIGWLRDGLGLGYGSVYCLGGILMLMSLTLLTAVSPAQVRLVGPPREAPSTPPTGNASEQAPKDRNPTDS